MKEAPVDPDYFRFTMDIKAMTGIDLNRYKQDQMKRRLENLWKRKGFASFSGYFKSLAASTSEMDEFLTHMTINVTEFFRNPSRWTVLEEKILPDLIKKKGKRLRTWSAACSSGEEPYSLVMLLSKFMPLKDIHVLATDLDKECLAKAKTGKYLPASVKDVPPEFMQKYFQAERGLYSISAAIKNCVEFKPQNLLADPFDAGFDLIICRNVLIYFTEQAKQELFRKFNQALSTNGVLFLGSTEQLLVPNNYQFEPVCNFFYRKLNKGDSLWT